MSGLPDDMLSWLRSQILARKATAEAASGGPWVNTGQRGDGDAWQIHGAPTGEVTFKFDYEIDDSIPEPEFVPGEPSPLVEVSVLARIATLNYGDGGGVWRREDADHIVLNQPSRILAECDTQLCVLDDYEDSLRGAREVDDPTVDTKACKRHADALHDIVVMYAEDYGWRQ